MKASIFDATKTDFELSKVYADYVPEFIVGGIIKKYGKNIFAAERGTGKTRILLFIAYAIIYECKEVFGYTINSFGDILFLNLEIPEKDFKAFTDPIVRYYEETLALKKIHNLFITSIRECGNKLNDIKLIAQKHKPILIIIDSYKIYQSIICSEEKEREINNSNFEKVLRLMDELIDEYQTTIALINHTNKDTRNKESNADLMFGPGALPDFVDHVTLLRKTKYPNQRIVVPDKSRFCGEGYITTNLIEIRSSDPSSAYPDQLYFELIETEIEEADYLPTLQSKRIDPKIKNQIIEFIQTGKGTQEQAAEKFLGRKGSKGTISKILRKFQNSNT
jgi:hypothetical protein